MIQYAKDIILHNLDRVKKQGQALSEKEKEYNIMKEDFERLVASTNICITNCLKQFERKYVKMSFKDYCVFAFISEFVSIQGNLFKYQGCYFLKRDNEVHISNNLGRCAFIVDENFYIEEITEKQFENEIIHISRNLTNYAKELKVSGSECPEEESDDTMDLHKHESF